MDVRHRGEKVVLIGAGSAMFTRGLVADLIRAGWDAELALVDIDEAALQVVERLTLRMIEARRAPIRLVASTNRRQVLQDASIVICTIGVGGRRAWEQDVFIPRRHGIYQPVGDSVMPGGTSRALRMIPAMVAIAEDVVNLAPRALFFNYGNPMSPVCRAVRKAAAADVVGLCHGVAHVGRYLADILGVEPSHLTFSAAGMNHLTWLTEIRVDGQDAMPRLSRIARDKIGAETDNPFSWHLFDLFGAFPAVLDRHVTEFFPQFFADGRYYGKILGVDAFSFEQTIALGDRIFDEMREAAFQGPPLGEDWFDRIGGEHEQVIDMVESIRMGSGRVYSVNLPNRGQIPNLPAEAIVECSGVADRDGIHPIGQPALPPGIVGTLAARLAWVETVVDAALQGRRDLFIQALVIDGAVDSIEAGTRLADDLLDAQADYLPQFATRSGTPTHSTTAGQG
jgi:alpha-galactosidase